MAQPTQQQAEQWFLRTGGDSVFGPVAGEGLIVWAEQGRVLPGHEVSSDRKKWIPAVSLGFLKMEWYVDDGEGELRGPLNRAAAEALVKSGKVSERAQIISAEEVDVSAAAEEKAKAPSEKAAAPAHQKVLTQRIQELELQLQEREKSEKTETQRQTIGQLTKERDALAGRVTELEALCETLKRSAEKDVRAAEKKAEQLRGQNKKLEEQLEELTAQRMLEPQAPEPVAAGTDETLLRERDQLREQLEEAQIACSQAQERLEAAERGRDQALEKLAAINNERSQLQSSQALDMVKLEELHEQLNAARGTNEQLREVIAQKETDHEAHRKQVAALQEEQRVLEGKIAEWERACADMSEHLNRATLETIHWRDEYEKREKECQEAASLAEAVERQYKDVLTRMDEMKQDFDRLNLTYEKSVEEAQKTLARATEAERDFADLLAMANARDMEYLEKIAEYERISSLSPEKVSRFYADQAAIYQLLKSELEALSQEQENERDHLEHLKQMAMKRLELLQDRKQTLMKQLGASPEDMTRLSVREQSTDPAAARLRTEYDNLRFAHERDMRSSEERERELQRKLRMAETEANRLKTLAVDGERLGKQVQELTDQLRRREHELAEERKVRESERLQAQTNSQALVARIETLERDGHGAVQEAMGPAERSGKFPSWMHFKK